MPADRTRTINRIIKIALRRNLLALNRNVLILFVRTSLSEAIIETHIEEAARKSRDDIEEFHELISLEAARLASENNHEGQS